MSLSTSSFEAGAVLLTEAPAVDGGRRGQPRGGSPAGIGAELKAIAVMLAVVVCLDVALRVLPPRRLGDREMLRSFESMSARLATTGGTRVLFMGNSLTRNGYNLEAFNAELKNHGGSDGADSLHADVVALYGSSLDEWYRVLKRDFVDPGRAADAVVISLEPGGAEDELVQNLRVTWLPEESGWRDIPDILNHDLTTFEQRGEFLQAWASMAFAYRLDLRYDALCRLIPHYWEGVQWVNHEDNRAAKKTVAARGPAPARSYLKFRRMLSFAAAKGIRVVVVIMPIREPYELDLMVEKICSAEGAGFMDCRGKAALDASDFEDGWHLNKKGGIAFSRYMAGALPRVIAVMRTTVTVGK